MAKVKEELMELLGLHGEWCEEEEEEEEGGSEENEEDEDGGDGDEGDGDEGDGDSGGGDDDDSDSLFNPFVEPKGDEEEDEDDGGDDEDDDKGDDPKVIIENGIAKEYQADKQAIKEVREYVKKNPMFKEYTDELAEIASKAIQGGHKNPVEFAKRNLKSPEEWVEIGQKSGIKDAGNVLRSNVGGTSLGKKNSEPADYGKMSVKDFETVVSLAKDN